MHEPARRADDGAAEHLANALMSHAPTPKTPNSGPSFSHTSREMPRVLGPPGPGETMMPRGFIARIASTVFSSFLYTMCSQPRSPRYCEGRDRGGDRSSVVRGKEWIMGGRVGAARRGMTGRAPRGGARSGWPWRVAHLAEVIGERVIVVDDDDRAVRGGRPGDRARAARPPPSTRPDPSPRRFRAERRARTPPRTPPPSFPPFPRSRMRTSSSSTEACGAGVRRSAAPRAMLEDARYPWGEEIRSR